MNFENIVFFEDDKLDYEMSYGVLSKLYPQINFYNFTFFPEDFSKKFLPAETLIFVDLNLKGMDGLDLYLGRLKKLNYTTYVHTSSDNPLDVARCRDAGIDDFFKKKMGPLKIERQLGSLVEFFNANLIKKYTVSSFNKEYFNKMSEKDNLISQLIREVDSLKFQRSYSQNNIQNANDLIQKDPFREILNSVSIGVVVQTLYDFEVIYMNDIFKKMVKANMSGSPNKENSYNIFFNIYPRDKNKFEKHYEKLKCDNDDDEKKIEFRILDSDGQWIKIRSLDRIFERDTYHNALATIHCISQL